MAGGSPSCSFWWYKMPFCVSVLLIDKSPHLLSSCEWLLRQTYESALLLLKTLYFLLISKIVSSSQTFMKVVFLVNVLMILTRRSRHVNLPMMYNASRYQKSSFSGSSFSLSGGKIGTDTPYWLTRLNGNPFLSKHQLKSLPAWASSNRKPFKYGWNALVGDNYRKEYSYIIHCIELCSSRKEICYIKDSSIYDDPYVIVRVMDDNIISREVRSL